MNVEERIEQLTAQQRCSDSSCACQSDSDSANVHCAFPENHTNGDATPSLSIFEGDDGKIKVECFAGTCDWKDVRTALGLNGTAPAAEDDKPGLTLREFAGAKGLDDELLEDLSIGDGVSGKEGTPCVTIPYFDRAGQPVRVRRRIALDGKDRFRWAKGSHNKKPIPYGLWLLDEDESDYVIVVEGETDTITLLQNGFPAVGIPGVETWKKGWAEHVGGRKVFIWQETDEAGAKLAAAVTQDVPGALVITPPAGVKDANELWLSLGQSRKKFERELARLLKEAKRGTNGSTAQPLVVWADTVKPEQVDWYWFGRLLAGGITMLGGQPSLGKSYSSLAIAARMTKGEELPLDSKRRPPGDVLILSAEDRLEDTIVPRLMLLGADLARAAFFPKVGRLAELLPLLEQVLTDPTRNFRLLVIDPINVYLGGVNTHVDSEYRAAVAPLNEMLHRTKVACLLITHLTKDLKGKTLLNAFQGSIAAVAAPRVALGAIEVTDDLTGDTERAIVHAKWNLTGRLPSVSYTIDDNGLFHFEGTSDLTNEDFGKQTTVVRSPVTDKKVQWLKDLLEEHGGAMAAAIIHRLALEHDDKWSPRSLEDAKRRLRIDHGASYNEETQTWSLPE